MRFAGWYAVLVGASMMVQWTLFLATGNVPELRSEPIRISFHLAGEFLTAILLLIAGAGLLRHRPWARTIFLLGAGMLLYTAIVSPGYFAQQGQWYFLAMFGVVLALGAFAVRELLRTMPGGDAPPNRIQGASRDGGNQR